MPLGLSSERPASQECSPGSHQCDMTDEQQQPSALSIPGLIWSVSAWGRNCQPSVSVCWPEKARLGVGRLRACGRHWLCSRDFTGTSLRIPHWTCPVLRAQELVAQNCGQGSTQGKQCFIPPRKEIMKTHICCCTLTSRCNIYVSKQRKGQFRLSQTILR